MNKLSLAILRNIFLLAILVLSFSSCTTVNNKDIKNLSYGTCEGCHTDYEHLKLVYTADDGPAGGDVPYYEPYDRVYMSGAGYEAFKESGHYRIGCVNCHNGVAETSDKVKAHSGDFLRHPSDEYAEKCGTCHPDNASNFASSLHNGTGQKRIVTMRSGLTGHEQFDQLPQHKIDGYTENCATCHGTCGTCHVNRPPNAGGGLAMGHQFTKSPDMTNTCLSCHESRSGDAYLGTGDGLEPDIHLTDAGFECIDCHTGAELHGNGETVNHRYAYTELPECQDCHATDEAGDPIEDSNSYHSMHITDFNCQVCHSQDYNTCGSCHIDGDGVRIGPYRDFKIALNPLLVNYAGGLELKDGEDLGTRHQTEFALVRRNLAAPDNWDVYHNQDYTDFEQFPTYSYTTPHNIQRWTSRTETTGSCFLNCHIRNDGGTLINTELYLWADSLETWEYNATLPITVDGKLPGYWF